MNLQLSQNKSLFLKNDIRGLCCISMGERCPRASWLPTAPCPTLVQKGPELPQPHSTWLHRLPKTPMPFRVTNLLPFRFCHPKLVVAQQEGPHGLADLGLDAPVVDEAQQLLLLVTLWWGEQRVCLVNRKPGADSVIQFFFSDLALRKPGMNEQSHMYPIPTTM